MKDGSDWQLLSDHLQNTAKLAAERGEPLRLTAMAELAGAYHDLGKHNPAFQAKLFGKQAKVDHSTAGAKLLIEKTPSDLSPVAKILAYAILGHHAGLPDRDKMEERLDNHEYCIPPTVQDPDKHDLERAGNELEQKIEPKNKENWGFDASVAARMVFSCLVDADFRDTEAFYDALEHREKPRIWDTLADLLPRLRASFDTHMAGFSNDSDLNRRRTNILQHIRTQATMPPGLFTLTVPTGGGKTLASLGFALDHATTHGHRRIIYAIPYTSIIDQTAAQFRKLFGEHVVLEHHSAIDVEETTQNDFSSRDKLRLAMEDWAAPIIVTTNVQLFESLFAARPSRCRKLHNIAGSVIILDEAQVLPRPLLLPTLRMIDTLARHYDCTIVMCTATQPAFDSNQLACPLKGPELAPNPEDMAREMRRAHIVCGGEMNDTDLITALGPHPQALIIVNSRKHALSLYRQAKAKGLEGLVHLTTRQTPIDRRRILKMVKARLKDGHACRLIATSLVEAGVDVDFPVGWRAEAGLDSVVQAAGRINREGKQDWQKCALTVFTSPDNRPPRELELMAKAMWETKDKFENLLAPEAIRDWFEEIYWTKGKRLDNKKILDKLLFSRNVADFAFRTIAEAYRMIDDVMVPVIIPQDDTAIKAVKELSLAQIPSGKLAREIQSYTVQIPAKDRDLLRKNGKGSFHCTDLRGDQFFVLDDLSIYREDTGLDWEDAERLTNDQSII